MAYKKIIFSFLLLFFFFESFCQEKSISLLFTGDVMQHDSQINAAYYKDKGYDYEPVFKYISPIFHNHDLVIANLELTLAGPPFRGYPQFSAPDELAIALKNSGVDILVTANNHSNDRRGKGVKRTLDILDSLGIKHTGTFRNKEERNKEYPLIIEKDSFKIALLNYTYGTNGIPDSPPTIVNRLDESIIIADIKKAKTSSPDKIIVVVHWGLEYQRLPGQEQLKWEKLFYDNGVDAVIGMHPHVIQPIKRVFDPTINKEKITAYSLGNFVSNQRKRYTDGGLIVSLEINRNPITNEVRFGDAGHYLTWVYKEYYQGTKRFHVIPADNFELTSKLPFEPSEKAMLNTFISDSRSLLSKNNYRVSEYRYSPLLKNFTLRRSYKFLDFKTNYSGVLNINPAKNSLKSSNYLENNGYYIQLAALNNGNKNLDLPKSINQTVIVKKNNQGLFKYHLGPYSNKEEALDALKEIKDFGYSEAFLITY
ncbi:CapA family protein [Marinigracilibium pacificum]|uniref:CapA family protein n=1 Tax=Marinigracilibium pacificum TaxID=2729599 RepID=A0A848IZE6_9BACT|nr:CapA family protein [Marinigracilibium pacificum]NMM48655.1 CapA family protein [Marinigracilibium pacificum]